MELNYTPCSLEKQRITKVNHAKLILQEDRIIFSADLEADEPDDDGVWTNNHTIVNKIIKKEFLVGVEMGRSKNAWQIVIFIMGVGDIFLYMNKRMECKQVFDAIDKYIFYKD